jgi:hypothetical protein
LKEIRMPRVKAKRWGFVMLMVTEKLKHWSMHSEKWKQTGFETHLLKRLGFEKQMLMRLVTENYFEIEMHLDSLKHSGFGIWTEKLKLKDFVRH